MYKRQALRTAIVHETGTGNRIGMASAVNRTALVVACRPDTFDAAATLAGAVAGPVLGAFPAFLTPPQQDRYRTCRRRAWCRRRPRRIGSRGEEARGQG